jgi:hypothetical protein
MAGQLDHSPADILRRVLIALGQGTAPTDNALDLSAWPIYAGGEPGSPDNVITLYDTPARQDGRSMIDGERQEHHGVQVRVRGATFPVGYAKARAIATAMDTAIYDLSVTLDSSTYRVHSVSRQGDVISLGKESPQSKRSVFTVNAIFTVRKL